MEHPVTVVNFLSVEPNNNNTAAVSYDNNIQIHQGEHHAGPEVWGNHYWNVLHVLSITGANEPEGMFLLLHSILPELLPCAACRANHMLQMLESHGAELANISILSKLDRNSPQRRFEMILFVCQLRFNVTFRNMKCRKKVNQRLQCMFQKLMGISINFNDYKTVHEALESKKKDIQNFGSFISYNYYNKDLWFMIHLSSFILPHPQSDNEKGINSINDIARNHQFVSFSLFIKILVKLLPRMHIYQVMRQWCICNGGLSVHDNYIMQIIDYKHSLKKVYGIIDNICFNRHKIIIFLFNIHELIRRSNKLLFFVSRTYYNEEHRYSRWNKHIRRYRELVFLTSRYEALLIKNMQSRRNIKHKSDNNSSVSNKNNYFLLSKFTSNLLYKSMYIVIQMMRSLRSPLYPHNSIKISNVVDDVIKLQINKLFSNYSKIPLNYKALMRWVQLMMVMDNITNVVLHSGALLKRSGDVCRENDNHEYNYEFGKLINYKKIFKAETYRFFEQKNIDIESYHCLLTEFNIRHYANSCYIYPSFRRSCLNSDKHHTTVEIAMNTLPNNNIKDNLSLSGCCDAVEFDANGICSRTPCVDIINPSIIGRNFNFCNKHIHYYSILNSVEISLNNVEKHINLIDTVYKWSAYVTREFLRYGDKEHNNIFIKPLGSLEHDYLHNVKEYRHLSKYNNTFSNEETFNMTAVTLQSVYHMSMAIYSLTLSKILMVFFMSLVRTCVYKNIELTTYLKTKFPLQETLISSEDCKLLYIYHSLHKYIDRMFLGDDNDRIRSQNYTPSIIALHEKKSIVMKLMMNPNALKIVCFSDDKKKIILKDKDIKVCVWLKDTSIPIKSTLQSIYVTTLPSRSLYKEILHHNNQNDDDINEKNITLFDLYKFILHKLQIS